MKKLVLLLLALACFTACGEEECFGKAEVYTTFSWPRTIVVDKMPKNCDDGTPDMEEFNKKHPHSTFVRWI